MEAIHWFKQPTTKTMNQAKQGTENNLLGRRWTNEEEAAAKNKDGSNKEQGMKKMNQQRRSSNKLEPMEEEEEPGRRSVNEEGRRSVNEGMWLVRMTHFFFYSEQVKGILAISLWLLGVPTKMLSAQNNCLSRFYIYLGFRIQISHLLFTPIC